MRKFLLVLDSLVHRWVSPLFAAFTSIFAFLAAYDFASLAQFYPNWPGLFELLTSGWPDLGFFFTAPIAFFSALFVAHRQPTVARLQVERDGLKEQVERFGETALVLLDGVLLNLSRKLKFENDSTVRLSVYLHIAEKNCFVPFGRFSSNPELQKKGRTRFPDNEGCIAKAWQNSWHFDSSFPQKISEQVQYNSKHYSIPEITCRALKMKPVLIAAQRVQDIGHGPEAVIVVESTRADAFKEADVRTILEDEAKAMGKMLHDLRKHIPTPQEAESRGL